jgi:hypothetical protein
MTLEERLRWELEEEKLLHEIDRTLLIHQIEVLEGKLARK